MTAARTFVALWLLTFVITPLRADWPSFRGPGGLGVSSDTAVPLTWGPKDNVVWKTKLPGNGTSSPIVWKDRVYLTGYTDYGLIGKGKGGDVAKLKRHLLCVDRKTGAIIWRKDVATKMPETDFNNYINEHGYASSTPVTDGERIYVFFGRTGVLAFDLDGKELWQTEVGQYLNSWGSASSPILYRDKVIVNAAVERSSLVALDKKTGKEVWRVKGLRDCWSTPLVVEVPGGKDEIVLGTPGLLIGVDPENGEKLWHCDATGTATASSTPIARAGIVYAMVAGFNGRNFIAIKAGGRGDVTKTHVLWEQPKAGANHTSPVLVGDRLYYVSGQVYCLDAKTGKLVYQQRLYDTRMEYVSPVAVGDKIIAFTRTSGAYVFSTGDKFVQHAHNDLGDSSVFNASPALSGGQLFIRSNEYLYCIGKK
jgi:outer membrane protein assembly factor BamB